jgi:hypothetical protein
MGRDLVAFCLGFPSIPQFFLSVETHINKWEKIHLIDFDWLLASWFGCLELNYIVNWVIYGAVNFEIFVIWD